MKRNKGARRSQRTQRLITEALLSLMAEQRYDTITVQQILERTNVGRSTFYTHYYDKEDVLVSSVEQMLDALRQQVEGPGGASQPILPTLALFRHVQDHYPLYQALVHGRGAELLFQRSAAYFTSTLEAHLNAQDPDSAPIPVPIPITATHVAGALLTLLNWWLDHRMPYTPEQMDAYLQHLLGPHITNLFRLPAPEPSHGTGTT